MINAYHKIVFGFIKSVEFGRKKEHKITLEYVNRMFDNKIVADKWIYSHYGVQIVTIKKFDNGDIIIRLNVPSMSASDRDNANGMLNCLDIYGVKIHTKNYSAYLTIPNDNKNYRCIMYDKDKNKWDEY